VLNARNAQLRIRLWELEQLFAVLSELNAGKTFTNYATAGTRSKSGPLLKGAMDMRPGKIIWAGHSFGACTTVQFVKSIYYHQDLPSMEGTEFENNLDWRPLLRATENSKLVSQITAESPMVLLDLWAMPLRAGLTRWLWEKPLPCYERKLEEGQPTPPTNVIAIVSSEFYKWPELLNRMKAALSARPAEAIYTLEKRTSLSRTNTQTKSKQNSPVLTSTVSKSPEDDVIDPEKTAEGKAEIDELEGNHEDTESDLGDDLFVTPFATGGSEFPFEHAELNNRSSFDTWRHTMDLESLRQLREADASTKEEADEHILRKALDSPVIKGKEPPAVAVTKPVSPSQLFMTPILPAQ
jgi:hypothetical protein